MEGEGRVGRKWRGLERKSGVERQSGDGRDKGKGNG